MAETSEKTKAARANRRRSEGRMHRDWMSMLLPIFITVGISVVANVGVGIWQGATFKAQVQHIDQHQTEQDGAIAKDSAAITALITRLPIDYVPRVEHDKEAVIEKELRDMENQRMQAMESKLDIIIENQHVARR